MASLVRADMPWKAFGSMVSVSVEISSRLKQEVRSANALAAIVGKETERKVTLVAFSGTSSSLGSKDAVPLKKNSVH